MRTSFPIPLVVFALGLLAGCGGRHQPTMPVEQAPEACCTQGDMDLQKFAGCRVGGRCRQGEVFWMRGAVACGPVDDASCAGGRCCHYRPRYNPGLGAAADETSDPADETTPDETPDETADDIPASPSVEPEPAGDGEGA